MTSFGNTNLNSARFVPYLYNRIKSIVMSFTNNSLLAADNDNILIPTEADGSNPVYTNTNNTFRVFYGGAIQTLYWVISVDSQTNVTTSQTGETISVTSLTADEGQYVVKAVRPDYTTITKTVKVYKAKLSGQGLDGADGLGWTNGSYNSSTGIVTFTSNDGLGFTTGDLRGAGSGGTVQSLVDIGGGSQYSLAIRADNEGNIGTPPGDTRGNSSTDLQTSRSAATEVASGDSSVITGGSRNTASGTASTVTGGVNNNASEFTTTIPGGINNIASGIGAHCFGNDNDASGSQSVTVGRGNIAKQAEEVVIGRYSEDLDPGDTTPKFRIGTGTSPVDSYDSVRINEDRGIFIKGIKSGTSQVNAGAAANELWIDTADNSIKIGI